MPMPTGEWRANWLVVAAAMVGFSVVSVAPASLSLFMEPLTREFGWSRATVSIGLLIFAAVGVPLSPFIGGWVDRWGARAIAIPGIILSSLFFAAFGLANGSVLQWCLLWTLYSLAEVTIKSYVWATAISRIFVRSRGLAVAVTLCGAALAQTLAPVLARILIDQYGWRTAFMFMGSGWGLVALLLVFFFFRDDRPGRAASSDSGGDPPRPAAPPPGLSFREALRSRPIQFLFLITILQTFFISSFGGHNVPILSEIGVERARAAALVGLAGAFALIGKLLSGYLLDRSRSLWIGAVIFLLPALSCLLLPISAGKDMVMTVSILIIGFTTGASLQVITYWTAQFAGLNSFGRIYGLMTSAMALAMGVGPVVTGWIFDRFGSYDPFMLLGVVACTLSAILALSLGRQPDWKEEADLDVIAPKAVKGH